jgi:hypothetical protein
MTGKINPESRSGRVRLFIAKNPNMDIAEVARNTGEDVNFVYQVIYKMKQKLKPVKVARSFKDLPKLLAKPKVTAPKEVAKEWDVDTEEVIVPKSEPDVVNHPEHYKVGGIETIDFIEAKMLDYNLGNAVKYISRADHKGNRIQDLKKARWYIDRAIMSSHIG